MMAAPGPRGVHVAVIGAADGIRFVALEASWSRLLGRVADYVKRRVAVELGGPAAERIRARLSSGELHAAIREYFAAEARQWDDEWVYLMPASEEGASTYEPIVWRRS